MSRNLVSLQLSTISNEYDTEKSTKRLQSVYVDRPRTASEFMKGKKRRRKKLKRKRERESNTADPGEVPSGTKRRREEVREEASKQGEGEEGRHEKQDSDESEFLRQFRESVRQEGQALEMNKSIALTLS
mmetsp:Transcript_35285/g.99466  ORF Transcript_35285/g.99466 Transcript_35285/m.99466 type:complete len:130 (-) Transcript_35285:114-503(-)